MLSESELFTEPSELPFLYLLSNELSSSPEDVPMVNMGPFFFMLPGLYADDVFNIGVGCAEAKCVCDRYEDGAPPGTNPRTTLWVLISVEELSCDPTVWKSLEESLVSIVDADESIFVGCALGGWGIEASTG